MPEYPGGIAASVEYIQKNMRYPEAAEKNGTQGVLRCNSLSIRKEM